MSLRAEGIGFRYGRGEWLFQGVGLTVEAGEIVGLSGPSGCGKTTLARILAGYERPHEGTVTLRGAPIPARGWHPVQLVMQHPEKAVNPRWTMRRILNEGWTPGAELLEALGIRQAWMDRRPAELSGGELQRFCVARALGPGTRMLVADEMTAMLDAITQAQIWQVALREAKERRIGMLVISHERALLRRICDRIVDFDRLVGRSGIGPPRDGDAVIN